MDRLTDCWVTQSRMKIPVAELRGDHLRNIVGMLKKNGYMHSNEYFAGLSSIGSMSDAAADSILNQIEGAKINALADLIFEEEAGRDSGIIEPSERWDRSSDVWPGMVAFLVDEITQLPIAPCAVLKERHAHETQLVRGRRNPYARDLYVGYFEVDLRTGKRTKNNKLRRVWVPDYHVSRTDKYGLLAK